MSESSQENKALDEPNLFDSDLTIKAVRFPVDVELGWLQARAHRGVHKPIFVVGCPRSGTTVTGACLAAHPELAGGDETFFLIDFWRIFSELHQGKAGHDWTPLAGYLSTSELLDAIGTFSDRIYGGLQNRTGKPRSVDHTPWYVTILPFIELVFPDAYFVHVIRDGRDVVRSLTASFAQGRLRSAGSSIGERARFWADMVQLGRGGSKRLRVAQYMEVRYENLCSAPRETLEDILHNVGLQWDESVMTPLAVGHVGPSRVNATLAVRTEGQGVTLQARNVGGLWPEDWSDAIRSEFLANARVCLEEFGYMSLNSRSSYSVCPAQVFKTWRRGASK
jgi:hypothetical protein